MKLDVSSVRVAEHDILDAIRADNDGQNSLWAPTDVEPVRHLLPVDPGFTIDMASSFERLKGQDMEFSYRASPTLLGRPMPATQNSAFTKNWELNFDVFVFCDGHSSQRDSRSWVRSAERRLALHDSIHPYAMRAPPRAASRTGHQMIQ